MTFHIDAFVKEITDLKRSTQDKDQRIHVLEQRLALAEEVCKVVEDQAYTDMPTSMAQALKNWQNLVRWQFRTNPDIKKRLDDALVGGMEEVRRENKYNEALEAGLRGGHGVEVTPPSGPGEYEETDHIIPNHATTQRIKNEVDGR